MRRVSARCCFLPGIVACVVSSSSWVLACDDVAAVRAKVTGGRPITLSANTPSSSISTFALGQSVTLGFKATGMKPRQDDLSIEHLSEPRVELPCGLAVAGLEAVHDLALLCEGDRVSVCVTQ